MNKSLIVGTIVGTIGTFVMGFLTYGMVLMNFFQANMGSATGVMKSSPDFLFLILGHIPLGALLAYIYTKWAGISTFGGGAKAGAIIGLLVGLAYNLIQYGTTNISTMTGHLGDVVVTTINMAIAGGLVGWAIGKWGGE